MYRRETLNGLQFHHNSTFNKEINPVSTFQFCLFVNYRQTSLALDSEVAKLKFMRQAFFVRRFEQTGA